MRILKSVFAAVFILVACRMAWTLGDAGWRVVLGLLAIAGIVCSRFLDPGEVVDRRRVWIEMAVLAVSAGLLAWAGAPWFHRSLETQREFFIIMLAVMGGAFIGGSLTASAVRHGKPGSATPASTSKS
jgi:drug/metabolite transporter (DMT)-like permease